jgi:shikimate kinase / 3-dehydroquinate synthase
MNKLVITGFMGTGKSTLGHKIAEAMELPFIDTDDLIAERLGMSVPEIFAQQGEAAFRAWEATIAAELSQDEETAIISTGGGMMLRQDNRQTFAADTVICLNASPEVIVQRLEGDGDERPLLRGDDPLAKVEELLRHRQPQYRQFRWQIDTSERTPDDLAEEIIDLWRRERAVRIHEMRVRSPEGFYPILEMHGALRRLPEILDIYGLNAKHVVIGTDDQVNALVGEYVLDMLPHAHMVTIPVGERAKNLETVHHIYNEFAGRDVSRSSVVIALGGGVVGDTFGYAAATYLRGLRVVQIPTTLLAMVDSSVGGKVGVDVPMGKNLVGAFKQPDLVVIDPAVLETLPTEEMRAGMAEVIKHGLLSDKLDTLSDLNTVHHHIRDAVKVKIDVVERDPFEQGERAFLNLGHTFAHAIERVSMYQWRHGDAVAVGLVAAGRLSHELGLIDAETSLQVEEIVAAAGLPIRIRNMNPGAIWEAMHTDKKWRDGRSHFIVLRGIGQPDIVRDVPRETVVGVLQGLCDD